MLGWRETIKRYAPRSALEFIIEARARLAPPPLEDIVLHDYAMIAEAESGPRLSLVIPSIAPDRAFGGVTTGLEIFLECGKRAGADLRIILDDFGRKVDRSLVDRGARALGLDPAAIDIIPRTTQTPAIAVRSRDIFVAYNWWTALNIRSLIEMQAERFGCVSMPLIYIMQDYEPGFFSFSSTHMFARSAYDSKGKLWGVFNSLQLRDYFHAQGHRLDREYDFEPRLSPQLMPYLEMARPKKERQILVYGRPSIGRNCFPAIVKGLAAWTERHTEYAQWPIVSAGMAHTAVRIGGSRTMESLGKLPLEDYARLLQTTAVGLSLMASPHPSYPPLEMAHFGVRTVTNSFANKDLGPAHENIISIGDVAPATIAEALARACRDFEAAPEAGWRRQSHVPSFLQPGPFAFLDELARDLQAAAWA